MVFLSASKVMVGAKKQQQQDDVSIEIRGPLASTKEHKLQELCQEFWTRWYWF